MTPESSIRAGVCVSIVIFFALAADCKVFDRCELARDLVEKHGVSANQVSTWICLVDRLSNFNTSAIGIPRPDGSRDHGIFQIDDEFWCSPPGKGWVCGLTCSKLHDDDIADDVRCVKRVFDDHQKLSGNGFKAYDVYDQFCDGNTNSYTRGCFDDDDGNDDPPQRPSRPRPTVSVQSSSVVTSPSVATTPPSRVANGNKSNLKIHNRCSLARELVINHQISKAEVGKWVCISNWNSGYNTSAIGRISEDGPTAHGIFQIGDEYWCSNPGRDGWKCDVDCSKLLDTDLTDDVICMKQILEEHGGLTGDGFDAWDVFTKKCKNNLEIYTRGCFPDSASSNPPSNVNFQEKPKGLVFNQCQLARELVFNHQIKMDDVAKWVCISRWMSSYNTSAIGKVSQTGPISHGIFQISDEYWCFSPGIGLKCEIPCERLLDSDITDDVKCMKLILEEHGGLSGDGFEAWDIYTKRCKANLSRYTQGCFDGDNDYGVPSKPV